jgi:dTDP-4-amino-4,6-dideoxygalactose transaminase
VQALVLRHQMKRLDRIIRDRRRVAAYLTGRLSKVKGLIPQLLDTRHIKATYHLYLIQVDPDVLGADVQVFKKKLSDRGVTNIPHFGPLYKFSVMRQLGYDTREIEESCPNAEMVFSKRFTHLPLYGLAKDQVKYMADAVIESAQEMRAGR